MTSLAAALPGCLNGEPCESEPGVFAAGFRFPPDFPGFSGHFPDNPVLPGIVQIMAAAHVAGRGAPLALRAVRRCKFLRPVRPDQSLAVTVALRTLPDGCLEAKAELRTDRESCALMTLLLDPPSFGGEFG